MLHVLDIVVQLFGACLCVALFTHKDANGNWHIG